MCGILLYQLKWTEINIHIKYDKYYIKYYIKYHIHIEIWYM